MTAIGADSVTTDRELLERFLQRREEAAFAALIERHGPMVFGVCRRVLRDEHEAEDAFQATFLVLARRAASIRRRDAVSHWLYGVAYRVASKLKARTFARREKEKVLAQLPSALPNSDPIPLVIWRELRVVLDEELSQLPDKYRAPIVLCYLQGKTNEGAAKELGWSAGSMSKRLAAGKEMLRERLEKRGMALTTGFLFGAISPGVASAAVSPAVATATVKAVLFGVAGKAAAAGLISANAALLTEGVLKAMFMNKLKTTVLVLFGVGALSSGSGIVAYNTLGLGGQENQQEAPQKPEPKAAGPSTEKRLAELRKAKREAVAEEWEARWQEFIAGRGTIEIALDCARRLLNSERELAATKPDQIAVLERHVKKMKEMDEIAVARVEAGRIHTMEGKQIEYHRLEAEIWLEEAKSEAVVRPMSTPPAARASETNPRRGSGSRG